MNRHDLRMKRYQQLKINKQSRQKLKNNREIIPCSICKEVFLFEQLTLEHIIPLSFGGSDDLCNVSLACKRCNFENGKKSLIKLKQKKELKL